jgi:hypothetical protein
VSAAHERVSQGQGSEEDKKLDEAYINNDQKQSVKQTDKESGEHPKEEQSSDVEAEQSEGEAMNNNKNKNPISDKPEETQNKEGDDNESSKEEMASNKESNAEMVERPSEEGEQEESQEKDVMDHIDAEDLASGCDSDDDKCSRPEDYDAQKPGDLGLGEEGLSEEDEAEKDGIAEENAEEESEQEGEEIGEESPDFASVLHDDLDSNADSINREKVVQMIGQALEGFKNNKEILERAKEKAPELYSSSIAMLQAMIEMAKMLGLSGSDQDAEEMEEEGETPSKESTNETAPKEESEEEEPKEGAQKEKPSAPEKKPAKEGKAPSPK